jgi:hypothetical protein
MCPEWPTSHTLPRVVVVALERAMVSLRAGGVPARLQDILGIAVVVLAPETPEELIALMTKPHAQLKATVAALPPGRYQRALGSPDEQLMVRLPSPVTLRLNALVDQLQSVGFRTTRRQVVSALALHRIPRDREGLLNAFELYRTATAGAAGVKGRPVSEVLSLTRPKPGRRRMA